MAHGEILNRGVVIAMCGQLDRSQDDLSTVIRLQPGSPDGYFYRGTTLLCKNDLYKVESDFTRALEINPSLGVTYVERTKVFVAKRKRAVAHNNLLRARNLGLQIDPSLAE